MISSAYATRLIVTLGHNCFLGSPSKIWAMDPNSGDVRWSFDGPTLWTNFCAGDKEGADIRRAMGGREKCGPNSWSMPVTDSQGDIYVGSHVGALYRYGWQPGVSGARNVELLSTLSTGVAFQDAAIAIGSGVMAVSTCTSLIVFQAYTGSFSTNQSVSHDDYSPITNQVHGEDISHDISEELHDDPTLTPKFDADDIWKNDQPTYNPINDNYGPGNADNHPLEWSPSKR
jgi:hypothetical protein